MCPAPARDQQDSAALWSEHAEMVGRKLRKAAATQRNHPELSPVRTASSFYFSLCLFCLDRSTLATSHKSGFGEGLSEKEEGFGYPEKKVLGCFWEVAPGGLIQENYISCHWRFSCSGMPGCLFTRVKYCSPCLCPPVAPISGF